MTMVASIDARRTRGEKKKRGNKKKILNMGGQLSIMIERRGNRRRLLGLLLAKNLVTPVQTSRAVGGFLSFANLLIDKEMAEICKALSINRLQKFHFYRECNRLIDMAMGEYFFKKGQVYS